MVEVIRPGQIELKVHGLTSEDHGRVPARVFANKLKQLVSILEAADTLANGKLVHTYVLASMHMSEPTAVLAEVPIFEFGAIDFSSAIPTFNQAVESIKTQDSRSERFVDVARRIGLLTSGVESNFGFAEVRTADANVIRIDDFLRRRAAIVNKTHNEPWFSGTVFASFDGMLGYVDARGALPQIKLTLTPGGKEIDCICRREDIEALGDALTKRVRLFGRAIYAGYSPLPIRVEVSSIEPLPPPGNFSRWKGSFKAFEIEPWELES